MTFWFLNTGSNSLNTGTNWSIIGTGGAPSGLVPGLIDDIVFDVNSGNCSVDVAAKVVNSITFSAYVNTLTPTNSIQTTDFFVTNGTLGKVGAATGDVLISRHLTVSATRGLIGTGRIVFNGTGTWTGTGGGYVFCNVNINTAGTITLTNIVFTVGILTYTAGTTTTTGTAEFGLGAAYTLNVNGSSAGGATATSTTGINWSAVMLTGGICTLSSPLTVVGTCTATNTVILNGSSAYLQANLVNNTGVNGIDGTTHLRFNGTSTISGTLNYITNNITITGTATITGTLRYSIRTFTNSGTLTATAATLIVPNSGTFNLPSTTWAAAEFTTGTVTINSAINVTGTTSLTGSGALTFAGSAGFTTGTLTCTVAGKVVNYTAARTYTVTGSLVSTGTILNPIQFISTSTGALFNLQVGATQNVTNTSATWMNSSGGQTIYTTKGFLSNTTNWNLRDRVEWFKAT